MIYPTALMIWISAAFCVSAAGLYFYPTGTSFWQLCLSAWAGFALLDGLFCLHRPKIRLERTLHQNLPVTSWSKVGLKVINDGKFTLSLEIHDHCDTDIKVRKQPTFLTLQQGKCASTNYSIFPTKRGAYTFPGADLLVKSPLHLWSKRWFCQCSSETKVFPNFKKISHYVLLATHHQLSMMGIKKLSKRGAGKEFHQLREYRQGDELQKIDWKATSRQRRLISKSYQDERDQQIIFILDCGRRMHHADTATGVSHLDQALNSILLLSYVGVRQGDSVGLYSFGGTEKWLPPRKHEDSIRSLLLGMYDITSSTNASDYLRATQDILVRQNRRALMVIITNTRDEDHQDLLNMSKQLRKKHLVVIANLREEILEKKLQAPVESFQDASRFQALNHYLEQRKSLHKQLQHLGIYTLDITPKELPAALVNCYLEIKNTGSL